MDERQQLNHHYSGGHSRDSGAGSLEIISPFGARPIACRKGRRGVA